MKLTATLYLINNKLCYNHEVEHNCKENNIITKYGMCSYKLSY